LRQLFPESATVDDPLAIYDRIHFPEPPADRPHVYLNMVSSVDGRAQIDGRAAGLGSDTDQAMMQRLRTLADCVFNGAGTVQADQVYVPLAPELVATRRARAQADQPLWAVITGSGKIRADATMFRKPPPRPIVFVADATPADRKDWLRDRADVVVVGDERPDPAEAMRVLRQDYHCRHVLSEGGPTLNYSMLRQGLVDELFWTLAPKIAAGEGKNLVMGPQLPKDALIRLHLETLYEDADELFFRYRVDRG
jgi:riboflavin-specific deaminase-like protein